MFNQNLKNETKEIGQNCKITIEEMKQFNAFKNIDNETLSELSEFVYQLSLILYKLTDNETA
jgi:hypothetical protein